MNSRSTGFLFGGILLIALAACGQGEQSAQEPVERGPGEEAVKGAMEQGEAEKLKVEPEEAPQRTTEEGMPVSPAQVDITEEVDEAAKEPATAEGLTTKEGVPVSPMQVESTEEVESEEVEP
ncbi:hypothetical protein Nhal_1959 [Nitrosococcus halophilus Nc 4]|uniref:Uncharacterized protein n=1 Tax=Nitrosococcus halophilus (strain Nc4) TaxID=472759 RepID=D5C3U5_NITHN|nr:hypothetical protein [Nitrosococcus halophilus]ADE15067.1 hypothetical protein Nhal_1959 [Nitrosococcus halophilus Nc 4]